MKKQFFLTLLIAGMFSAATAQSTKQTASGVSFGIRAGLNLQNINGRDASDDRLENKLIPRINAGITVDVPLADEFYLQPGLFYAGKGAKILDTDRKTKMSYIDIPVMFLFKPVLGNGHLLLGAGPYVGFALAGNSDFNGDKTPVKFKNSVTAAEYGSAPYARRMDAGANLQAGYELSSKLSFQLNAQLGLQKINPTVEGGSFDKVAARNTGFGLSVGYRF